MSVPGYRSCLGLYRGNFGLWYFNFVAQIFTAGGLGRGSMLVLEPMPSKMLMAVSVGHASPSSIGLSALRKVDDGCACERSNGHLGKEEAVGYESETATDLRIETR